MCVCVYHLLLLLHRSSKSILGKAITSTIPGATRSQYRASSARLSHTCTHAPAADSDRYGVVPVYRYNIYLNSNIRRPWLRAILALRFSGIACRTVYETSLWYSSTQYIVDITRNGVYIGRYLYIYIYIRYIIIERVYSLSAEVWKNACLSQYCFRSVRTLRLSV